MNHLYFFSGSITAFFLLLLLSKRKKALHDKVLALWFFILLFQIFVFYLESFYRFTFLLEISSALAFLAGPLIWLYSRLLSRGVRKWRWEYSLHLLPFAANLLIVLPYVLQGHLAPFPDYARTLLAFGKLASILFYCLAALQELRQHSRLIRQQLSSLEAAHLNWLRWAIYGILLVWALGLASQAAFLSGLAGVDSKYEDLLVNIGVSLLVLVIGYHGLTKTPVFLEVEASAGSFSSQQAAPDARKYEKSGLTPVQMLECARKLDALMASEKPFLDPELTLNQLAAQASLSANQLSQLINQHYGQNFYDFINRYRVEEVVGMMKSGKYGHLTILAIGLHCGFNSKASFNRHFKKAIGLTPSAYWKKLEK